MTVSCRGSVRMSVHAARGTSCTQGDQMARASKLHALDTGARRWPARAGVGVVCLVSAGLIMGGLQAAQAAPQKVLQSVAVELQRDGTVTSITSTAIRKEGDKSSDDEKTHDPSKVGDELPIRVLTSYRLGSRSGTNLNDLKGKSGRIYIDVTVQNTTVRPTLLTYDSEAQSKTAPALVGTPLTVVASADLGETDLSQVVSSDSGETGATNGVVSRDGDGNARVQWATMLAPPRLAASATFTLVQDAIDFEPPAFDVSVQTGLVTDTSVSRLVDSAFADDNGTQELTSRTVALLGSVGTVLTDASTVLSKVETQLDGSAAQLGTKTISDLESSASYITSALSGLSGDLNSLQTTMDSALSSSSDNAVKQLAVSFAHVKDKVLGDPDAKIDEPAPAPERPDGCVLTPPTSATSSTVYGQLRAVQAQLRQLAGATDGCRGAVVDALRTSLGTTGDTCVPGTSPTTAIAALSCASSALAISSADLAAAQADITSTFDSTLLGKVEAPLDAVLGGLDDIRTDAKDLGTGSIEDGLEDIVAELTAVQTLLATDGPLASTIAAINLRATDQLNVLSGGTGDGDPGAIRQAAELAATLCELPVSAERDEASVLLTGRNCDRSLPPTPADPADASEYTSSLVDKVTGAQTAWREIQTRSGTTAPDALGTIVTGLRTDVTEILAALGEILDQTDAGDVGELELGIEALVGQIESLYLPVPVPDVDGQPQPPLPPLRTQLADSFQAVADNQAGIDTDLADAFGKASTALKDGSTNVGAGATRVEDARKAAEKDAGSFFGAFSSSLEATGSEIVSKGGSTIRKQRDELDDVADSFDTGLSSTATKAARRIASQVGASNRDLESSEKRLTADLKAILVNIGQPKKNGSGLLGAIYTGARRTGASNAKIVDAGEASDAFSRVRGAALDDLYLQQAQVSASLEAEAAFPVFDLDVPAGSTHRTVFSFHIGQD